MVATRTFGPFGIGERFLVAGQSHAGNFNDTLLTIENPEAKAVAYDIANDSWRIAHDPQPAWPDTGPSHWDLLGSEILRSGGIFAGGSIWPAALDTFIAEHAVPVGIASVIRSGTTIREWLPGTELFTALAFAVRQFAPFRAVLWQVGETDAQKGTAADDYVECFSTIKTALERQTGFVASWIVAKSTLQPALSVDVQKRDNIRAAIDRIRTLHADVFAGPDVDSIGHSYRQVASGSRHFTAEGQRRAGLLWADAIKKFLPDFDASLGALS